MDRPWWVVGLFFLMSLVVLVFAVWMWRRLIRQRRRVGWTPLPLGLPRAQRKQLRRHVREGRPSGDPLLRYVETRAAQTICDLRSNQRWALPIATVGITGAVITFWNTQRWFSIVAIALLMFVIATLPRTRQLYRGASKYLSAVNP